MKKRNQKKINENFKGMKQRKDRNGKEQRLIFEKESSNEPTWRCRQNRFIGALRIQEPVILHEPLIKG